MEIRGTRVSSVLDGGPDEGPLHDLALTVRRLWPAASTVELRTSGRPERGALVAVPSTGRPRLLVPPGRAAGRALARYNLALSRRETAQRVVATAALAVGAGRWPTGRLVVDDDAGGVTAELERVLGEPVRVSLSIGTVRANRKPVLEVFDRRGRSLAFVKVGDSETAAQHVKGEAEVLARLGERAWRVLRVPRLLYAGEWAGTRLLVMSSLPTRPQWRDVPRLRAAAEREVADADDAVPLTLASTPMWSRAEDAVAVLDGVRRERLDEALDVVRRRFGDRVVPTGAWHGDWTPWNMAARGRALQVWDWERYETGVPVGLDRLHHAVNVATRRDGTTLGVVTEALRQASLAEDPRRDEDLLPMCYLLAVGARYAVAAVGPGGDAIAPRADVVLGALTALCRKKEGR